MSTSHPITSPYRPHPQVHLFECVSPLFFDEMRPSLVVAGWGAVLNTLVGSMFGVVETWNSGETGVPSAPYKWSLRPVVGSWNICHKL